MALAFLALSYFFAGTNNPINSVRCCACRSCRLANRTSRLAARYFSMPMSDAGLKYSTRISKIWVQKPKDYSTIDGEGGHQVRPSIESAN